MSSEGPFEVKCCHGAILVKPGDKLVIAGDFGLEDAVTYSKMLDERLPGVHIVFVNGATHMAVIPSDKE